MVCGAAMAEDGAALSAVIFQYEKRHREGEHIENNPVDSQTFEKPGEGDLR